MIQEQKLKMSPQMYQSIQLMALPLQDLRLKIQEELETNPALEVIQEPGTLSLDEVPREKTEEYDYFENSSDPGYQDRGSYDTEASDSKQKFLEGVLSRPESLQDHLLHQLRLQPVTDPEKELGELLIRNLDQNGFHQENPDSFIPERLKQYLPGVTRLIQGFDPTGTCTAGYRESLTVQTLLRPEAPPGTVKVIENYLELVKKENFTEMSKHIDKPETEIMKIVSFIKQLNPFPGRLYSTEMPQYVIPDLLITRKEGEIVIIMNDTEIPVLGISPFFSSVMKGENGKAEKETRRFVADNVKNAEWFLNSIRQRNRTLLKTARAIVDFQRDFFIRGPKYMVPLTLKDIATEVKVHETTISRISHAKYVQTEWGIFPLKYFFSNSISGAGTAGSRYSKSGVKEIVREILAAEQGEGRLSDQKIADILKERGIPLARRTVAKYRKELDIDSSYSR